MSCHSLGSVSHLSVSITKCPSYWIHFSNPGALRAEKMLGSSLQRLVSAKVLLMPSTSFMSNPQTNKSFKQNPVRIRASILHPGLPAQQVRCLQRSEGWLTVREAAAASQHHVISLQCLPCSVSWDDPVRLQLSLNGWMLSGLLHPQGRMGSLPWGSVGMFWRQLQCLGPRAKRST